MISRSGKMIITPPHHLIGRLDVKVLKSGQMIFSPSNVKVQPRNSKPKSSDTFLSAALSDFPSSKPSASPSAAPSLPCSKNVSFSEDTKFRQRISADECPPDLTEEEQAALFKERPDLKRHASFSPDTEFRQMRKRSRLRAADCAFIFR